VNTMHEKLNKVFQFRRTEKPTALTTAGTHEIKIAVYLFIALSRIILVQVITSASCYLAF